MSRVLPHPCLFSFSDRIFLVILTGSVPLMLLPQPPECLPGAKNPSTSHDTWQNWLLDINLESVSPVHGQMRLQMKDAELVYRRQRGQAGSTLRGVTPVWQEESLWASLMDPGVYLPTTGLPCGFWGTCLTSWVHPHLLHVFYMRRQKSESKAENVKTLNHLD